MDERDDRRLEDRTDPLIELMADARRARGDARAFDDPRFLAWLTREGVSDPELLGGAELRAIARRVVRALAEEATGVPTSDAAPEVRRLAHSGRASAVVDEIAGLPGAALLDLGVAAGAGLALWDAECDSWIPLPAGMPRGRYLAVRVDGDSMSPALRSGDVVLVRLGSEVVAGAIAVVRLPDDGYVVKRVGRVGPRWIELLSVNPDYPALRVPRGPGTVLGTVVLRWQA